MSINRAFRSTLVSVLVLTALLLSTIGSAASAPQPGNLAAPDPTLPALPAAIAQFDSGWQPVAAGTCMTFNHNLGGNVTDYTVELWFEDPSDGLGIHRWGFGGIDFNGQRHGAHWQQLTASSVDVCRGAADQNAPFVRIRVWIPPDPPDYASPWRTINAGQTIIIPHNLNLPADNLAVTLWFRSAAFGVHSQGYGGLAINPIQQMRGAYWHHLTDHDVRVTRFLTDSYVDEVRVVVTQADPPTWDSGWQAMSIGPNPLNHNLNVDANLLLVRGECRSVTEGIHQRYAGGIDHWSEGRQGSHLQNLTPPRLVLVRWHDDTVCPQARVRIWRRGGYKILLPLIVRQN